MRRLAVPTDPYNDDCVANEKTYQGFGMVLWSSGRQGRGAGAVSQGISQTPYALDHPEDHYAGDAPAFIQNV